MFIFTFHEFRIYSLETILQVRKVITFSSFDVASPIISKSLFIKSEIRILNSFVVSQLIFVNSKVSIPRIQSHTVQH